MSEMVEGRSRFENNILVMTEYRGQFIPFSESFERKIKACNSVSPWQFILSVLCSLQLKFNEFITKEMVSLFLAPKQTIYYQSSSSYNYTQINRVVEKIILW